MTPDINVLVAAFRSDHVHHSIAKRWIDAAIEACVAGARFDVLPMVIAGFLRLVTNRKVFPDPTPIERAVEFIERLLSRPGVAAAVHASDGHLVTFDRAFKRLLGKRELTILSTAR